MAEKTGELKQTDQLDPLATSAGAGSDPFVEKYVEDYPGTETERRELATNTGEAPEETEHIKAQIEETRNQMGETIDAIQERLSFSNISDQVSEHVNNAIESAKDTVYDATVGKAVYFMKNMGNQISESKVGRTAMDNPFPLLLIGLGAGLLAYNSYRGGNRTRWDDRRRRNLGAHYAENTQDMRLADRGTSAVKAAQDTIGGVAGSVTASAGSAYEGVSGAVGGAYNAAGELTHKAYDSATEITHRAYEKFGEVGSVAQEKYEHYMEEKPLAMGAVALALGAAVGFAIPSTRYEGELMGETRDNLIHKAQETANEFVGKAKQVAGEAGRTINQEVRSM